MRVLVHMCCGPCAIAVIEQLLAQHHDVCGFFYNPNIQPLAEYLKRREGAVAVARSYGIPLIMGDTLSWEEQQWHLPPHTMLDWEHDFFSDAASIWSGQAKDESMMPPALNPVPWLRALVNHEHERCAFCSYIRMERTVVYAAQHNFDGYTSSLLYSRWQKHDQIRMQCEQLAHNHNIVFLYQDFRTHWQHGITRSKELGVYRQQYCGCMYSEYERYQRDMKTALTKNGDI